MTDRLMTTRASTELHRAVQAGDFHRAAALLPCPGWDEEKRREIFDLMAATDGQGRTALHYCVSSVDLQKACPCCGENFLDLFLSSAVSRYLLDVADSEGITCCQLIEAHDSLVNDQWETFLRRSMY